MSVPAAAAPPAAAAGLAVAARLAVGAGLALAVAVTVVIAAAAAGLAAAAVAVAVPVVEGATGAAVHEVPPHGRRHGAISESARAAVPAFPSQPPSLEQNGAEAEHRVRQLIMHRKNRV